MMTIVLIWLLLKLKVMAYLMDAENPETDQTTFEVKNRFDNLITCSKNELSDTI